MASVLLGDLDDFIAPGQACINPLFTTPDDTAAAAAGKSADGSKNAAVAGGAPISLVLEDDRGPLDAMQVCEGESARGSRFAALPAVSIRPRRDVFVL